MNNDIIAPTGEVIKDYIDYYGYTQKEVCKRLDISEKHLSNVLNGKARLTEEMALKLEKLMPVSANYWLTIETKYREYLAREEETYSLKNTDLKLISKKFKFNEVFKGMDYSLSEQAIAMLKLLKINNYDNFDTAYGNFNVSFMQDGGEKEPIAVWINLCEAEIELQNDDLDNIQFSSQKLKDELTTLKYVALNENVEQSINNARTILNSAGIYLVLREAITNCKVRGVLTTYRKKPAIYLSGRFKTHDNIWFALLHEIAHILFHYNPQDIIVFSEHDILDQEGDANIFARNFFVNEKDFAIFKSKADFSVSSVVGFASEQNVSPGIIVAFLQHDKCIKYGELNNLKKHFKL